MKARIPRKMGAEEEASILPPNQKDLNFKNEKMRFGFSFSAADGESGNQSEDNADLPSSLTEIGHQYNPNLSEQNPAKIKQRNEITDAMHLADKYSVGLSFTDKDSYTDLA